MKIAIISPAGLPIPAVKGGAVETLVTNLCDQNEKKYEVGMDIYSPFDKKALIRSKEYRHVNFFFVNNNFWARKVKHLIDFIASDVFNSLFTPNNYLLNKYIKLMKGKNYDCIVIEGYTNYVLKLHRIFPDTKIILHLHNDLLNKSTPYSSEIYNVCFKIFVVSNYIKSCVETVDKKIRDFSKVIVINNGVDAELFKRDKSKIRTLKKSFRILSDDVVIVYAGRLIPEKGVYELITAIKKINNPRVKLLVIGASWFSDNRETKYIRKLREISVTIKNQVIFTNYISHKAMPYYYSIADLGVVPSIWNDPAPLSLLEEMSMSLPVIAFNRGGIGEYIGDKSLLIDLNRESINKLSFKLNTMINSSPIYRKSIGNKERENILRNKYTIEGFYERFIGSLSK